jgi:squalene-associated FAD-dependent desaturase
VSGLAAAAGLTARGIHTLVLEQKPVLGGRAFSFVDGTTGDTVDNGQHVLIAGYERTMALLRKVGALDLLTVQEHPALLFHHPAKGFHWLRLPPLPSPLHLAWGLLRFKLLSSADRWRALRAGVAIYTTRDAKKRIPGEVTAERWLDGLGQSLECKRSLWEPLALAIMNEQIAQASAQVFVHTLRAAFLRGRHCAAMAIPRVGLSALYAEPVRRFITNHGGTVRCGADVVGLQVEDGSLKGVRLRNGDLLPCRAAILAVPPNRLATLLPEELRGHPYYAGLQSVTPSPIISIFLWFDLDFMKDEFVGLVGRTVQWVFNKRRISGDAGKRGHIVAVISAAYDALSLSNEQLTRLAVDDVRSAYPGCPAEPTHALVLREKRATFPSTPRSEQYRPPQRTPLPNLFLAGDWTATGYPATIEGAVLSAERSVDQVIDCISLQKW